MKSRSKMLAQVFALQALSLLLTANLYAQSPAATSAALPATASQTKRVIEPRKTVDNTAFRDAVSEARAAMDRGDFAAAQNAYSKAIEADPGSSSAYFNQGVAQYRAGELKAAEESFASAAQMGDERLAAQAMFNEGNSVYAEALKALEAQENKGATAPAGPDAGKPNLAGVIETVKSSLIHYKDAVKADATDTDARINAETATRLLKKLEEMKEQEDKKKDQDKEKQDQSKDDQKKDDQKKDGQNKGDQKKGDQKKGDQPKDEQSKDGQPKDEQSKDGQPKDEQSKDGQPKDEQSKDGQPKDGQPKDEQPKDGSQENPKDEQQKQNEQQGKKPDEKVGDKTQGQSVDKTNDESKESKEQPKDPVQQKEADGGTAKPAEAQSGDPVKGAPLTKREAERILQAVRDREKTRRESKDIRESTKRTPVGKDW